MTSKLFLNFNRFTLVSIFLVILAGSVVRTTGSGMGCPDWPKCFGQAVPPTSVEELPSDYVEIFLEKRVKKVNRFASLLEKVGMQEVAEKLRTDPKIFEEEPFNARKTWTEYINRVFGVIAGFAVAIVLFWTFFKYRRKKILRLAFLNAFILIFQAWFGSIVVATNLVPWTITVHMLLAVAMVMIQLKIIFRSKRHVGIESSKKFKILVFSIFAICFTQMVLGSQVRQEFDQFYLNGVKKIDWLDFVSIRFIIHRSFSWMVLVLIGLLFFLNKKLNYGFFLPKLIVFILIIELISGIILAYVDVPAIAQTIHLLLACVLFSATYYLYLKSKVIVENRL